MLAGNQDEYEAKKWSLVFKDISDTEDETLPRRLEEAYEQEQREKAEASVSKPDNN